MTFRRTYTVTVEAPREDVSVGIRAALEGASLSVVESGVGFGGPALRRVETPGTVNRPKLIKLAQWAAAEHAKQELGLPSEWNQGSWLRLDEGLGDDPNVPKAVVAGKTCGTAACMAGKVALDAGGVPVVVTDGGVDIRLDDERAQDDLYFGIDFSRVFIGDADDPVNVSDFAAEELGLNSSQASLLFAGDNTLADVLRVIKDILVGDVPKVTWEPVTEEPVAIPISVGDRVRIVKTGRYGGGDELDGTLAEVSRVGVYGSGKGFRVTLLEGAGDTWGVGNEVSVEEVERVAVKEVAAEIPEWKKSDRAYQVGDKVTYEGATYECRDAAYHNAYVAPGACSTCWTKIPA